MSKTLASLVLLALVSGCSASDPATVAYLKCFTDVPFRPLPRATLRQTGQPLDLAVKGEGYFSVRDLSTGRYYYTRFGQYTLKENRLVTGDGRYDADLAQLGDNFFNKPAATLPADVTRAEVSPEGIVSIERRSASGLQPFGQLKLSSFPNREGLRRVDARYYEESCSSGAPLIEAPRAGRPAGLLTVGVLEEEAAAGASDTVGSARWHVAP